MNNRSLGLQLSIVVIALLASFTAALVFYVSNNERNNLLHQSHIKNIKISEITAFALLEPLLEEDYPVIEAYMEILLASDPSLLWIEVTWENDPSKHIKKESTIEYSLANLELVKSPILIDDDKLGEVTLAISNYATNALIQKNVIWLIGFIGMAMILLIIALLTIFQKFLLHPIAVLSEGISHFGHGDLSIRLAVGTENELGRLARGFNNMADQIVDRNEKLMAALSKAQEATQLKSQFLANMSHEIRTPMNAIIGFTDLLAKTDLSNKQEDFVYRVKLSSENLSRLINDILDFSKIESGKLSIESIRFSLRMELDRVNALFSDTAHAKNIELSFRAKPNVPDYVIGDPLRFTQVLVNLVSNAIKFTEAGHVSVVVDLESPDQHIDTGLNNGPNNDKDNCRLLISVKDSGIGLDPKVSSTLFNNFVQADGSITRKYGGTGLGLSICKELVRLMGGDISVSSEEGEGSVFSYTLKLQISDQQNLKASQDFTHLEGIRVLLIDDTEEILKYLTDILYRHGIKPYTTNSGSEAISLLKQKNVEFDLIIVDWMMPEMNGLTAVNHIRALRRYHEVPILLTTAYDTEAIDSAIAYKLIDGCLYKPLLENQILQRMAKLISPTKLNTDVLYGLDSKRILIVDDVELNQRLLEGMLEHYSFSLEFASNGKEAVDKIELASEKTETRYDCILMDIQMPIMDGYKAINIIRSELNLQTLPIIALTANAMSGDRDACINAGASDYLSKPIDSELLDACLIDALCSSIDSDTSTKKSKPPKLEKPATPTPDKQTKMPTHLPGLDVKDALTRMGGKQSLYVKMANSFSDLYKDIDTLLLTSLQGGDVEQVTRLLHTIKGSAGTLGAYDLRNSVMELEVQFLQHGYQHQELAKLVGEFSPVLESCQQIKQWGH